MQSIGEILMKRITSFIIILSISIGLLIIGGYNVDSVSGMEISPNRESIIFNTSLNAVASGKIGKLNWSLDNGVLVISGNGAMPDYTTSAPPPWKEYAESITSIEVKNGVTSVGKQAFVELYNLETVTIANSVTKIGEAALYGCSSLTSVNLGNGIKTIEAGAFANTYNLTSLTLPAGITEIGDYIINNSGVKTINLPANLSSLTEYSLSYSNLTSITVSSNNKKYKAVDGVLYTKDGKTLLAYPTMRIDSHFIVPSGVEVIGNSAFIGVSNLQSIDMGRVKKIGEWAFSYSKLQTAVLPDTVTELGYGIFSDATKLKSIKIGKGIKTIPYRTCFGCESLKTIDFGNAEEIGQAAFYQSGVESIVLPKTLKELGVAAFAACYNLKSVKSNGLIYIAYQAFASCSALKDVSLNEGIKNIYAEVFRDCIALKALTTPKSCTFVHERACVTKDPNTSKEISTVKIKNLNTKMVAYGLNGYMERPTITGVENYNEAYDVLKLVNSERQKAGLSTLTMDKLLLKDAMLRAEELVIHFDHYRPNNTNVVAQYSFFSLVKGMNIIKGENIAFGQADAKGAMNSWMNSQGHRENILGKDWKYIGIGCFEYGGRKYWVQCFSDEYYNTKFSKPSNKKVNAPIDVGLKLDYSLDGKTTNKNFEYEIQNSKPNICVGQTANLNLVLKNAYSGQVTFNSDSVGWKCSDTKIATINNKGIIKGVNTGTVEIVASNHNEDLVRRKFTVINHTWDSGKITKQPTTTTEGERTFTCTNCNATRKEVIPKSTIIPTSIDRIFENDRYGTAYDISNVLKKEKKIGKYKAIILADGTNYPDALAGCYLAKVKNASIILVNKTTRKEAINYIRNNLVEGGQVYILGGINAVDARYGIDLVTYNYKVRRLQGNTRYDTNIEILKEAGVKAEDILVCSGTNYADALSASGTGRPILLVGDHLTDAQKKYLNTLNTKKYYIIGGTSAVSTNAAKEIAKYGDKKPERVYGDTRYTTSVKVAERFIKSPQKIVLAYAMNFPDGLAGGPLALEFEGPVVLASNNKTNNQYAKNYVKRNKIKNCVVLGGPRLVSDSSANDIMSSNVSVRRIK